jgi:hypothetical protein
LGHPYGLHGTLAFPHHPFVRSPRDFFMLEPNYSPSCTPVRPNGR